MKPPRPNRAQFSGRRGTCAAGLPFQEAPVRSRDTVPGEGGHSAPSGTSNHSGTWVVSKMCCKGGGMWVNERPQRNSPFFSGLSPSSL